MTHGKNSEYTATYISGPVEGTNPASSVTVFTLPPEPPPSNDPNCPKCGGRGEVLFMYARPGGVPGNSVLPCDLCRKA